MRVQIIKYSNFRHRNAPIPQLTEGGLFLVFFFFFFFFCFVDIFEVCVVLDCFAFHYTHLQFILESCGGVRGVFNFILTHPLIQLCLNVMYAFLLVWQSSS